MSFNDDFLTSLVINCFSFFSSKSSDSVSLVMNALRCTEATSKRKGDEEAEISSLMIALNWAIRTPTSVSGGEVQCDIWSGATCSGLSRISLKHSLFSVQNIFLKLVGCFIA